MVEVVDTPGYFDPTLTNDEINRELFKALMLTSPGFHAIALVIQKARFTIEMKKLIHEFFNFFENKVERYAFIIFTHVESQTKLKKFFGIRENNGGCVKDDKADWVTDPNVKTLLKGSPTGIDPALMDLIEKCGGNIMIMDNTGSENKKEIQVQAILEEVVRIKKMNNSYFRNGNYKVIDDMIKLEREKFIKSGEEGKFSDWLPNVCKRYIYPNVEDSDEESHRGGSRCEDKDNEFQRALAEEEGAIKGSSKTDSDTVKKKEIPFDVVKEHGKNLKR